MASITKYATQITQTSAESMSAFANLNNLKNANATYSKTSLIGTKSQTRKRPATLFCRGFNFNLPAHAKINKIIVEYAHQKLPRETGKYPSIARPTLNLIGFSKTQMATATDSVIQSDFPSLYGVTPTKDMKSSSCTWTQGGTFSVNMNPTTLNGSVVTTTFKYNLPVVGQVNASEFGVRIDYPQNTNAYQGYLQLQYIRIRIEYVESEYSVAVNRVGSGPIYEGLPAKIQVTLNNLNNTDYANSCRIQLPSSAVINIINASFDGWVNEGNNTFLWTPVQSSSKSSVSFTFSATFNEGDNTIIITELLNNVSDSLTLNVQPVPSGYDETGDFSPSEDTIYAVQNQYCTIPLEIPEGTAEVLVYTDKAVTYKIGSTTTSVNANTAFQISTSLFTDNKLDIEAKFSDVGEIHFFLINQNSVYKYIKVIPSTLEGLQICVLKLSDEELDRLGDGYNYNVSCFMQILLDAVNNSDKFHDYYRNFRVGVVNHIDATNNINTIFEACKHWCSVLTVFNSWQEKSIEFTYNKEYPVYVVVTGGYSIETPYINTQFSHICIQETDYAEYVNHGVFPEPIENTILDGSSGELTLQDQLPSNDLILYDFPFNENFGTGDDYAIRGIELILHCDTDDRVVCNATLKSPSGEMGQESIILTPGQDTYTLGGNYDLWGFLINDLQNIKKWELLLVFNNVLSTQNRNAEVNILDVQMVVHFLKLGDGAVEKVYVNGENLEWYGAFIQEFSLISGLKTNTQYLNIEGSDVNEAHLMTIEPKEINLEFDIDGCNLRESTELLSQITRLLTNKRDELDRPIPKQITCSAYPNEYWEYQLEEGIEPEREYTGYKCKCKLTIPAGTSFDKEDTVTNTTGRVNSITKVNPIIQLVPTGETIEITEENTGQKWTGTCSEWIDKVVEIDCEHRIVTLIDDEEADDKDISYAADWNTTWFIIDDMYIFTGINCIIQTITTTGRG